MSPTSALTNVINGPRADVVSSRQFFGPLTFLRQAPNFLYVFLRELGGRIAFAMSNYWPMPTTFRDHINGVVTRSADKQMRWIDACGIIAAMTHKNIVGNWSMHKRVGESVCTNSAVTVPKLPVTRELTRGRPFPTIIGAALINFLPEAIFGRTLSVTVVMAFDEAHRLACYMSEASMAFLGYRGSLPTTAVAVTIGNVVRGIMRLHQKLAFLVSCRRTVPAVAAALCIGSYRSSIAQMVCSGDVDLLSNLVSLQ